MKLILALFLSFAAAYGQVSVYPPSSGAATKDCAAAPGDTTGTSGQLCKTAAGALYVCNQATCTLAAHWVAVGSITRTWNYAFQGGNSMGVAAFAGNLPTTNAPAAKINASGDLSVLDFPTAQSTYYWYGSWRMPPSYQANGAISYTISSMCDPAACDSTHAANVYISLSCTGSTARPDAASYTEIATPVAITNAASGYQVVTSGTITPGSGGLPSCATTNRATVKLRVDTATNSLTGAFQLVAVSFYVQGAI